MGKEEKRVMERMEKVKKDKGSRVNGRMRKR